MKKKPSSIKPFYQKYDALIESVGGETIEGIFTSLQTEDQIQFLFSLLGDINNQIFILQQQVITSQKRRDYQLMR